MGKTLGYGEITVANMTEPFTVMLTNEAQQFATDSNRKVTSAQSYYTDIIVIRGSQERTDYTIGNITSGSGITVSKSSKRVTFSVSAGTTIGADTGVIEIPITLDGQTVKKQFSWSCGKQGPQGVQGNDGNNFAWNMLSETNCGKKHWGTESSGGKYSVEDFITEDNINAVKLICTEGISTSNWSYVLFKDIKMLKQLKPSTKYTLSYDIKANRSGAISHSICKEDVSNFCTNTVVVNNIIGNETWQHISVVLTTNDLKTTPTNEILYLGRNALSKVGYSIIKNLKLVEGDINTPWSPSQSDIEGKGVVETIQYYLATSQASGVTSSTSGWSTDITTQKLTADKKYLWNCYQTKYSDGTSEPISTPKIIGVYGDKGANALQCKRNWTGTYTTINGTTSAALSDFNRTPVAGDVFTTLDGSSNTGTWQVISVSGSNVNIKLLSYVNSRGEKGDNAKNLSITPSSQYFKSTDGGKTFAPNTITIKPTIQGEINFGKWQFSIDGGVSFTDVVSGQKGLTINNNVLTVSKDSSLYSDAVTMVTFRAVANDSSFYDTCSIAKIYDVSDIEIGGRNLLLNSDKEYVMGFGIPNTTWTDGYAYIGLPTTRINDEILPQNNAFLLHPEAGKTYTQTIWIETDADVIDLNAAQVSWFTGKYGHVLVAAKIIKLADNSYKLTSTHTVTKEDSDIRLFDIMFLFSALDISNSGTYLKFGKLKVEQGNVSTDWTPATEDVQTAILSTKSEISDVSLKVDKNKQAIEQRVEKTTYQQDLNLVKGDISKANEGLNKWRYEIYPKSLFASEYQGKSTMDVFAKNTNLTPSQSVLINDTDFGKRWAYGDNYIGYALTFVKFSTAKSVAITFKHDDGAHLYLNGKLIGGDDTCNTGSGESLTLSFIQGWNCLEVVLNEKSGGEYIGLGTTISAISECQLMNCYYGTPVARQSHITNQLVQNTTDIDGVSGSVQKVMSTVGGSGKIDEFVSNYATWKKKVDGIETRVGETYTTKDDFDDLQIGGRNLLKHSSMIGEKLICDNYFICNNCNIQEYTNDGFHIITPTEGNANNGIAFAFDNFTIMEINGGDTITFSCDIKGTSDSHAPFVSIHISDNNWYGSGVVQKNTNVSITKDWQRVSVTITTPTGLTKNHMWLAIHGNHQSDLYVRNFKLEKGNKPTDWTPAPEDVNGKIVNVETIANQTADKFSWIVKSGTSSSNFEITDRLMNLVSANINLDGIVSFMNTAKGDGRKNLYNLDYSSFENVASQEDAICYAKDNGVTSVGIDSSVSYDGDKSLKISYTTANLNSSTTPLYLGSSANNYGCVKIQAGKQYILSCYVKSDSTTGLFMIDIQGHDTPDTKTDGLYLSNIDPRKLPGSSTGVNLSTDWQRAVCAIKVADNATGLYWSVVPLIWGRPSSSSAPQTFNVWVDCIMLEEVDSISNEPGTYILDKETIIDGGSVKADTITGNQILAGSITADKIATDAIKSHNYISSGGTQGSFLNLGDGSFTSPNLSWDSNGNLIAKNANLSGLINATKGTVGGWNIATNGLYSGIDENAIKIYSATTYDAQTMYQKQKIQDSFILSQKYINHFVSQQVSVGHNIPYWQTRSFIYNDSQIQLAQSDYCINTSSASNYDAQYSLKDGYISATRIYMEQNITQVGGDVINSSFSIGLDSMMGWCSIQSTKGINIYGNSSRALYVQSNDTSKYNALETEGDVVVNGKIHAVSGDNKIQLNSDNNGSIELYGNTPFIDFHSAYSSADYTCRIIANTPEQLLVCGKLRCDSNIISNNDLIANSWVYAGQNAHYTWQNQLDCYFSCGYYNNTNNVYYYAGYHAFYVNNDSGSGMMYINTNGVTSRVGFTKTSDERIKKNFESFDDNIIDAYMNIEPVKYQLKQSSNDNYHFGFKAQHIDKIFSDYGDTYNESFDICTSRPIDPDKAKELYGVDGMVEEYGLRYDELIAPTTYMVQHIYKELEQVRQEKADLEARLQAIEAKLGF
jgi:hypothetical protein